MPVDFHQIKLLSGDTREPLTLDEIIATCHCAFGEAGHVESVEGLDGGEFNAVYRVRMAGREPVILRAAPPATRVLPWHEHALMRREVAVQPYFAPLGPLLPRTLFADFTRQLMPRDYLFQQDMPGVRWLDVEQKLSPDEEESLWREFAAILQRIHAVTGDTFGQPWPGRHYASWSATALDWLDLTTAEVTQVGEDIRSVLLVRDIAARHADLLDEIHTPRLLHGDLWTFNLLIERGPATPPRITAVLDYDRAIWGDPFFEWTFHLLRRRARPELRAAFLEAYGAPDHTPGQRLREAVYEAIHLGNALAYGVRSGNRAVVLRATGWLDEIAADLRRAFI